MKQLIALHDNLIVKPAGKQERQGILDVPQQYQKTISRGTVIDQSKSCTGKIQNGDDVIIPLHAQTECDVDGVLHWIVSESACLAILRITPEVDSNQQEMKLVDHKDGRYSNPTAGV